MLSPQLDYKPNEPDTWMHMLSIPASTFEHNIESMFKSAYEVASLTKLGSISHIIPRHCNSEVYSARK